MSVAAAVPVIDTPTPEVPSKVLFTEQRNPEALAQPGAMEDVTRSGPADPSLTLSGQEQIAPAAVIEKAEDPAEHVQEGEKQEEGHGEGDGEAEEEDQARRESRRSSATSISEASIRIDRWGFIMSNVGGDDELKKTKRHRELADKELSRSKKWLKMLKNWDKYESVKQAKVKRRIRKGIPDALRRQAWGIIVGLEEEMKAQPTLYTDLCARTDVPDQEIHNTIERDIDRTFPRHVMFREDQGDGQARLRRVLQAYSRHDPELGYCQGMGFITAMLLTYFPDDEAFYMIDIIMNKRGAPIRRLYMPMMPRAQEMMFVGDCCFKAFLPRLHRHFSREGIHRSMYMTQWVVCIFTNSFPFEMVTRVWDAFLAEGWKVVYRVILGILKFFEKELLRKDFEKLMEFFRVLPSHVTVEGSQKILDIGFKYKLKRKQLEVYEKRYLKEGADF